MKEPYTFVQIVKIVIAGLFGTILLIKIIGSSEELGKLVSIGFVIALVFIFFILGPTIFGRYISESFLWLSHK